MGKQVFSTIETSGVYSLALRQRAAAESAAKKEQLLQLIATIPPNANKDNALVRLGTDLNFPTWYGANFDALYDCLTDPDWLPAKGHVILIQGMEELRATSPEAFATLVEVLKTAAEARKGAGHPFWVLLDSPARGVTPLPEA